MALVKEGYVSAIRGTAYASIPMNDEGQIATTSDTPATTKIMQFAMANAENTQAENQTLVNVFFGFAPRARTISNERMRVIWEV